MVTTTVLTVLALAYIERGKTPRYEHEESFLSSGRRTKIKGKKEKETTSRSCATQKPSARTAAANKSQTAETRFGDNFESKAENDGRSSQKMNVDVSFDANKLLDHRNRQAGRQASERANQPASRPTNQTASAERAAKRANLWQGSESDLGRRRPGQTRRTGVRG